MVNFDTLCTALDPLGWSGVPVTGIAWKFFKQVPGGMFKAALVQADGSVQLSATHFGKMVQYRLTDEDWQFLDVLGTYVREVEV